MTRSRKDPPGRRCSISELANEFDVGPRTIRFYEEKNLIMPARTKGNQRVYSGRDRARLELILRGKRFGYSLDEISEMIGMTDVDMSERAQIEKSLLYGEMKPAEIRERIEEPKLLEQDILDVKARLLKRLEEPACK